MPLARRLCLAALFAALLSLPPLALADGPIRTEVKFEARKLPGRWNATRDTDGALWSKDKKEQLYVNAYDLGPEGAKLTAQDKMYALLDSVKLTQEKVGYTARGTHREEIPFSASKSSVGCIIGESPESRALTCVFLSREGELKTSEYYAYSKLDQAAFLKAANAVNQALADQGIF